MVLRWLVAAVHLLALGIGLGAVLERGFALRGPLGAAGLRRAFRADALWGLAALLWISTGVWRAFGGLEKGSAYYLGNHVFWTKMALLGAILVLEVRPMLTLIRWRRQAAAGAAIDPAPAASLSRTSLVQAALVALMVFAAAAVARGVGA